MSETTSKTPQLCGLCEKNASKYCCPRCEVYYCSLECYKSEKHMTCSESFYRDWVNEELASNNADDESRKKMIEILKRMQESNIDNPEQFEQLMEQMGNGDEFDEEDADSDDDQLPDLHERIAGLNLDDPDALWGALTQDERNEFEALLSHGDVGNIVPQWEPWWCYVQKENIIEDVDEIDNSKLKDAMDKCPSLKDVPKLTSLTTVQPSPTIKFNITNVLASYAFIMRYYNGEIENLEGAVSLLNICSNLDGNANFDDAATAVEAVAQKCLQSDLIQTDELSLNVMKHDTFLIIRGPHKSHSLHYCKAALSHLHDMLAQAKTAMKTKKPDTNTKLNDFSRKFPDHGTKHLPDLDGGKVKKCLKKIEYYLSYLQCNDMEFD